MFVKPRTLLGLSMIVLSAVGLIAGSDPVVAAEEAPLPKETLRAEIFAPMMEAQGLSAAKKYQDALAKIDEADAVADKTPYESYVISHMRGATAYLDGNFALAAKSFSAAMASDRLTAAEYFNISLGLAGQFYKQGDYPNAAMWAQRYLDKGGPDPQIKTLLAQTHYLRKDYAGAASLLQEISRADDAAGRVTGETQLKLWANCEMKLNHGPETIVALEKLVTRYPKKEYWNDLIYRVRQNPKFPDRLALDFYRLQLNAGVLESAEEFMDMAGLAMQAGFPSEAKSVLDRGYAGKLLGSGPDAAKHKKLLEQAQKAAADDQKTLPQEAQRAMEAKTGTLPVNTGFNLVLLGQFEKGIALIERGIAKGGLKTPESATLKLAMAYVFAGQKDKAVQTFKSITATDGAADLARLWVLWVSQS